MTEPVFTKAQIKEDGTNRVAKTGAQASVGAWVITVLDWFAHQIGWNGELPTPVAVALAGLLTAGAAYLMNRGRIQNGAA